MFATTLILASALLGTPIPNAPVPEQFANLFEAHEYVYPRDNDRKDDRKGTGTFSALDRKGTVPLADKGTVPVSSDPPWLGARTGDSPPENWDPPQKMSQSPSCRIPYRLFVPRNLKPGERCPLLLWLHGAGEGGTDNRQNLRYVSMVLRDTEHLEGYRFFILVPQCPPEAGGWTGSLVGPSNSEGDRHIFRPSGVVKGHSHEGGKMSQSPDSANDMLTVVADLLEKTMREQPVDPDRVYLLGISSGGNACWDLASRHPDWFAAIVPISPGCGDLSQAAKLAATPIWVFQDYGDRPEATVRMVEAIEAAGGNIHLTMPRTGDHDTWTLALRGYDVVNWMLEQRREARICWRPPGCKPWRWWHILGVPLAFAGIVGVGWYSEQRRRGLSRFSRREGCSYVNVADRRENGTVPLCDAESGKPKAEEGATDRHG